MASPTSLYVHVPFCVVKCGYCDFNSFVMPEQSAHDRFLQALDRELELRWRGRPSTVFLGGGTPSLLSPERLRQLLAILQRRVDWQGVTEITMEANPESFTAEKAEIALANGVTRLSIGMQTFHAHHLRFLDRAHDAAAAVAAFTNARAAGFANISLDLMFGLPGETLDEWRFDLDRALELAPDHISAYNLTFEPGTALHKRMERGDVTPNEQEVDRAMFDHTRQRLAAAGFTAYEISNFAGRGGPCQHNDHYWLQGDYVGVGPGAASHQQGVRATNCKALEAWASLALQGLPTAMSAETLTPRQRAGEALWLGIRRREGVDVAAVAQRLRLPVMQWFAPLLHAQRDAGLVTFDGARVALTARGLPVADRVGAEYLS